MARKPDGKLGKIVTALEALLAQDKPDPGQVLLKSNSAAKLAGGRGLREILGEEHWARLQAILHPHKTPQQLANAA